MCRLNVMNYDGSVILIAGAQEAFQFAGVFLDCFLYESRLVEITKYLKKEATIAVLQCNRCFLHRFSIRSKPALCCAVTLHGLFFLIFQHDNVTFERHMYYDAAGDATELLGVFIRHIFGN